MNKKILITMIFLIVILLVGVTKVEAATYSKEFKEYSNDELIYSISIESEGLPEGMYFNSNQNGGCTYINGNYKIYSKNFYNYEFLSNNVKQTSLNGKNATVLIHMPNLVENDIYDVYYIDRTYDQNYMPVDTLDESLNGVTGTVVKINDKLYIKVITNTLKSFALNQRTSNEYQAKLAEITTNGIYNMNAIDPSDYEAFDLYAYFTAISAQENYKIEPIYFNSNDKLYMLLTFKDLLNESHLVEYKYTGILNNKIKSLIDEIADSLRDPNNSMLIKNFVVEDLNYINYLNNVSDDAVDIIYYSSELKEALKGTNFVPYFDYRAGDSTPFNTEAFGLVVVSYNGTLYPLGIDAGYKLKQVIYVPNNTTNTDVELIKAAKQRIIKYLGITENDFSLTIGGTRASLSDINWDNYDLDNISSNYYNLTINGQTVKIVIEKNDEKVKNLDFITRDILTDIEISSVSGNIPLDTYIKANQIDKDSNEYKEILKKINKETGLMFDLKLFSSSLNEYVTELENGIFEVRIPLTDEYKEKKLSAYYIDEEGKLEEYNATTESSVAKFNIKHFSIYTIAEKSENTTTAKSENEVTKNTEKDETPKTGSINYISTIMLIAGLTIVGITIARKIKDN